MKSEQHIVELPWVIEEIKGAIKELLDSNENENRDYQNLWVVLAMTMLRGKCIARSTCI
jgi:hypothetical protein